MLGFTAFISYVLLIVLTLIFIRRNNKGSIIMAFIIAIALIPRIWLISNPALGDNDEKYHALVAKNMVERPFEPLLYKEPILNYDINNWAGNHIWLSKPPVTFWLIATSIKYFGNNVFAVRLPSIILFIIAIFLIYRIGKSLFNQKTANISAFLFAIQGTFIELGAGEVSSDHVDLAFNVIYLLSLNLCLQIDFTTIKKNKYLYTIFLGFIFGILFLTKWHVAGFIIPIWISLMLIRKYPFKIILTYLIIAMSVCIITVMPWFVYAYNKFPLELKSMVTSLISPIHHIIQGHSGPWYYYIDKIGKLFGELVYIPLLYFFYIAYSKKSWKLLFITFCILIPILAFSLAETKRFTYILIIAPAIFLLIGHFISDMLTDIQIPKWSKSLLVFGLLALPIRFSIERIDFFTDRTESYALTREWKQNLIRFTNKNKGKKLVIFNTDKYIETMFYTNAIAYSFKPSEKIINDIINDGFTCYNFDGKTYYKL